MAGVTFFRFRLRSCFKNFRIRVRKFSNSRIRLLLKTPAIIFLLKKWPHRLRLLPKFKSDSGSWSNFSRIFYSVTDPKEKRRILPRRLRAPNPLPPPVGSRDSCFCNKIIHAWSLVAINYCGNCLLLPFHSQPPTVYMHLVLLEFLIGVSGLLLITLIFLVCLVYFLCKIMPSMLFFDDQFKLVVKISSQMLENPYL